jgi:hypothetical protein
MPVFLDFFALQLGSAVASICHLNTQQPGDEDA